MGILTVRHDAFCFVRMDLWMDCLWGCWRTGKGWADCWSECFGGKLFVVNLMRGKFKKISGKTSLCCRRVRVKREEAKWRESRVGWCVCVLRVCVKEERGKGMCGLSLQARGNVGKQTGMSSKTKYRYAESGPMLILLISINAIYINPMRTISNQYNLQIWLNYTLGTSARSGIKIT